LVGDCPGQLAVGKVSPGNGFRPFRTKGDDGGRHRRLRHVNRVFMSSRFDRPDFLDLESHSWCRASGLDGRFFRPPEATPLIVVLLWWGDGASDTVEARRRKGEGQVRKTRLGVFSWEPIQLGIEGQRMPAIGGNRNVSNVCTAMWLR